jgi:hypothetical protein
MHCRQWQIVAAVQLLLRQICGKDCRQERAKAMHARVLMKTAATAAAAAEEEVAA